MNFAINIKHLWRFVIIIIFFIAPLSPLEAVLWTKQLDDRGRHETSLDVDPYYTWIDYTFSLTEEPIPKVYFKSEQQIYLHMLRNFHRPRYMLLEASVNPMPIAGVYIKKHQNEFYEDTEVNSRLNLVKAATDGFPEPWALSYFFGNVTDFVVDDYEEESGQRVVGKGFSGFLLSYGHYHIVNNTMVEDDWIETEVKLKGDDIRSTHKISWSYALGTKFHDNENIRNAVYIYIKRSRIDYFKDDINPILRFFMRNSEQQLRIDFDMGYLEEGRVIRSMFLFGKKFPLGESGVTLSISAGMLKTSGNGYEGELKQTVDDNWNILIRPNLDIKF